MTRGLLALIVLAGCHPDVEDTGLDDSREPCADRDPQRNLYWGDLHVHTSLSFDAWVYDVRTRPDDAYRFAKGQAVPFPEGGGTTHEVRLDRPLDFAAVTDHAGFLGEVSACTTEGSAVYDTSLCAGYRSATPASIQAFGLKFTMTEPTRFDAVCGDDGVDCLALVRDAWTEIQDAAEDHYDRTERCTFTTLVGYEWTGATGISNLHRNVLFRSRTVPPLPTSYFEEPTAEGLWAALRSDCLDGEGTCDVLAIPHNPNWSNGNLYWVEAPGGDDVAWATERATMEPLVEIYQHKGDSECRNGLSGILGSPDEACDFEKVRLDDPPDCGDAPGSGAMAGFGCVSRVDFVRGVLLAGLAEQQRIGVNPYPLGIIASTDTHSGTAGRVDEAGYEGHLGNLEGDPDERLGYGGLNPGGIINSPGGLAAVWAEDNSRDSLFDALRRKEVYGTSGPRMAVRSFGGFELPADLCADPDLVGTADALGVPMGGTLPPSSGAAPPTFVVSALQDPGTPSHPGTPLQRVQIIKGWIDASGDAHQLVTDVAGGENGASVDPRSCLAVGTGAASLCGTWTDPDFDPTEPAFYYARVLENPTCRWSAWDCLGRDGDDRPASCDDPAIARTVQERAWTSPIHFVPATR